MHHFEIFFSYSHKDQKLRDELETQLSLLKREGMITAWHFRKIGAGKEWEGEIDTHLNNAQIILLLVSPDFIASDYCYDIEMERAMQRHEAGEARVIPVILRPTDWKSAKFGKLQALPTSGKPVTSWHNRDEAFLDVAQGIRQAVQDRSSNTVSSSASTLNLSPPIKEAQLVPQSPVPPKDSMKSLANQSVDRAQISPSKLRELMFSAYSLPKFQILCADLGVDYDNLQGETLETRMLYLIEDFKRQRKYATLVNKVLADHPYLVSEL